MNKRVAIGIAAALAGLVVITTLGLLFAGGDRRLGAGVDPRSYASGNYFVQVGGVDVGAVKSVEGCEVGSDVVRESAGADNVRRKHVANVRYDPCVIRIGTGMAAALYNWIAAMLNGSQTPKDVVLVETDYNRKEMGRISLQHALLTGVKFPNLDGALNDPASIELTLTPETIQRSAGSGATYSAGIQGKSSQKHWLPSNFRLTLSGTDASKVSRISGFEATQSVAGDAIGVSRDYEKAPTDLELGNLDVTVAASHSADFDNWFKSFIVNGNSGASAEKTATLEYLGPSGDVLFTLSFQGVGVFRQVHEGYEAGKDTKKRKRYSLYVETAAFSAASGSTLAAQNTTTGVQTNPAPLTSTTQTTPPPPPIEATITTVAGELLVDGETFTISDGVNEPTTFEFDLDGKAEWIPVRFSKEAPPEEVASAIVEAINNVPESLQVVAKPTETQTIQLQSERGGEAGEEKILEFVESEEFRVRDAEKEVEALAAPTELAASTGAAEGEIDLRWNPVKGALGYLVLFTTEPGSTDYIELDKSEGTELTVAGLKSGLEHVFVVRALDGTNVSKNSNEAAATAG
jgi:phage tail-like protein